MSGADFITSAHLRSTMTPLEQAWAVLKSDPRTQAWNFKYDRNLANHPDEPGGPTPVVQNRGTIDPNVYNMAMRARWDDGGYMVLPQTEALDRRRGTSIGGVQDARGPLGGGEGFTALDEDRPGAISRVQRPEAYSYAEVGSPQARIDAIHAQGRTNLPNQDPLTPEQQAWLAGLYE